jgi:hypothetical protein
VYIYSELRGRQGGQEGGDGSVVAERLAEVGEAVDIAGAEDETAAQLEGIGAEFVLAVAGGAGALAAFEIVATEEMENVGGFEIGDLVGLAVLVDEQGEVDAGFLLEDAGVVGVAEADGGEGGVFFSES